MNKDSNPAVKQNGELARELYNMKAELQDLLPLKNGWFTDINRKSSPNPSPIRAVDAQNNIFFIYNLGYGRTTKIYYGLLGCDACSLVSSNVLEAAGYSKMLAPIY